MAAHSDTHSQANTLHTGDGRTLAFHVNEERVYYPQRSFMEYWDDILFKLSGTIKFSDLYWLLAYKHNYRSSKKRITANKRAPFIAYAAWVFIQ